MRRARLPVVAAPPLSLQLLVTLSLTAAAALVPVELLDGFPQPLLRLPQPPGRRLGHRRLLMLMRGPGGWRRRGRWARAQGWLRAGGEVERRRREERHRRRPAARAWAWAGPCLDSGRVPSFCSEGRSLLLPVVAAPRLGGADDILKFFDDELMMLNKRVAGSLRIRTVRCTARDGNGIVGYAVVLWTHTGAKPLKDGQVMFYPFISKLAHKDQSTLGLLSSCQTKSPFYGQNMWAVIRKDCVQPTTAS